MSSNITDELHHLTCSQGGAARDWTIERSEALGMAVSKLLKGYTTTAATVTAQLLSSVTKLALQVRGRWFRCCLRFDCRCKHVSA